MSEHGATSGERVRPAWEKRLAEVVGQHTEGQFRQQAIAAAIDAVRPAFQDIYNMTGRLLPLYEHTEAITIVRRRLLEHIGGSGS